MRLTVKIQVVSTDLLQGLVQLLLRLNSLMCRVPELASDEEVFTLHYAWDDFLQGHADLALVLVDHGEI